MAIRKGTSAGASQGSMRLSFVAGLYHKCDERVARLGAAHLIFGPNAGAQRLAESSRVCVNRHKELDRRALGYTLVNHLFRLSHCACQSKLWELSGAMPTICFLAPCLLYTGPACKAKYAYCGLGKPDCPLTRVSGQAWRPTRRGCPRCSCSRGRTRRRPHTSRTTARRPRCALRRPRQCASAPKTLTLTMGRPLLGVRLAQGRTSTLMRQALRKDRAVAG